MGQKGCSGDHQYATRELGAGLRRLECRNCGSVFIDLDAAGDGSAVTTPGLFRPAKPTIFSVLRQERGQEDTVDLTESIRPRRPRHSFGGAFRI